MADILFDVAVDDKALDNLTAKISKVTQQSGAFEKSWRMLDSAIKNSIASEQELVAVYANLEKKGMQMDKVLKALAQDQKMAADAAEHHNKSLLGISSSSKSARDSASVFTQELKKQELALKKVAETKARDAVELENLRLKYKPLYSASKQYSDTLDELNRAHALGVLNTQQHEAALENLRIEFEQFSNGTAGWENQFVSGSRRGSKSLNRFGMYAQQVGYQVGDFLVQVQSGTNGLVAFGQQATQLAGLIPGLWGAVAGIGISAGTALALVYQKSKEAEEGISGFAESLKKAREESTSFNEELRLLNSGLSNTAELAFTQAILEAQKNLNRALEEQELAGEDINSVAEYRVSKAREALNVAKEELETYRRRRELLEQEKPFYEDVLGSEEGLALAQDALNKLHEEKLQKEQELFDAMVENQEAYNELVGEAIGKNTLERIDSEKEIFDAMMENQDAMNQLVGESIAEATKIANEFAEAFEEANGDAFELSKIDLTTGISAAAIAASNLSESMKAVLIDALELTRLAQKPVQGPVWPFLGPPSKNTQGGTKKTPQEEIEEYMLKLEREVALKREQVGVSDSLARKLELELEYKKRGIVVDEERIQALIKEEEALRKATEAEARRESMISTFEDNMEDAFMSIIDRSESVVDAFRDMMRNILLEVYRSEVAKPMAEGIGSILKGFLFKADGGAFQGGVEMFANGGVVGSPTMFRHSGGLGMMGEAGPEAIMPLKRDSSGKLGVISSGNGESLVVQQTLQFNFAANGDESVKKIIAESAPKIAEMAKQKVIDTRRRGGTMRATFS